MTFQPPPPAGVPDPDCQAYGQEELPGEEPGSRGDARIHLHHLLRQDRHTHPEPDDCRPHVDRRQDRRG